MTRGSLLSLYRRLLALRRSEPDLASGVYRTLGSERRRAALRARRLARGRDQPRPGRGPGEHRRRVLAATEAAREGEIRLPRPSSDPARP